ncbi:MAG: hypothetical protein FWE54_00590 [Methanimicrococcus sp.]|nr:hypothetical protein [Methanimicrococcus sp.]
MTNNLESLDFSDAFSLMTIKNVPLFHGTYREFVGSIMSKGFIPSQEDKNYLGGGIYFYDGDMFSIWWRFKDEECIKRPLETLMDDEDLENEELTELTSLFSEKYGVMTFEANSLNLLDMDNFMNKEMFDKLYTKFYQKSFQNKIFETTVYDFLFEKMGLKKKFDGIILTTNLYKLLNIDPYRNFVPQAIIPYRIYCIKNSDITINTFEYMIDTTDMDTCLRFMVLKEKSLINNRKNRRQ